MIKLILSIFAAGSAILLPLYISYVSRGWIAKYDSPPFTVDHIPSLQGKNALVTGVNTGELNYLNIF